MVKGLRQRWRKRKTQAPFVCYSSAFLFKRTSLYFKKTVLLQECIKRQLYLSAFFKCFPKADEGNQSRQKYNCFDFNKNN